jgi:hypothetical protein
MREALWERAAKYCERFPIALKAELGYGFDGSVWSTFRPSAIKVFERETLYLRERNVYLRLQERKVQQIEGFAIPALLNFDNELLIVEMEFVTPPFIVDFAGAYLDQQPPFSAEEWAEWEEERKELFEADWKRVKRAMRALEVHGIYLNDVKPGNVTCR